MNAVLVKAAELMSEAETCCVGSFGEDANGASLGSHDLKQAVSFCREGVIYRAAQVLGLDVGAAHAAMDVMEGYLTDLYECDWTGSPILWINDEVFPGDKEQAVLDLKRAAEWS